MRIVFDENTPRAVARAIRELASAFDAQSADPVEVLHALDLVGQGTDDVPLIQAVADGKHVKSALVTTDKSMRTSATGLSTDDAQARRRDIITLTGALRFGAFAPTLPNAITSAGTAVGAGFGTATAGAPNYSVHERAAFCRNGLHRHHLAQAMESRFDNG